MRLMLLNHCMLWFHIDDITSVLKMSMILPDNGGILCNYRVDLLLVHIASTIIILVVLSLSALVKMTYIMDDLLMLIVS